MRQFQTQSQTKHGEPLRQTPRASQTAVARRIIFTAFLSVGLVKTLIADENQAPVLSGIVANPCQPAIPVPGAMQELDEGVLNPNARTPNLEKIFASPDVQAYLKAQRERAQGDWANLCKYQMANDEITAPPNVVFIGDSITENWVKGDPGLFSNDIIGRGIGGQTSPQILLRFFQDVIDLHPRVVHIMAGTNDIAGNTGATNQREFENNIRAMVLLAKAHHIKVVLASIPPAKSFSWRPMLKPAETIRHLNAWVQTFAREAHVTYVDYFRLLSDAEGGFRHDLSNDGVHPNRAGYAVMKAPALAAVY
jgi:lysophospholipase L1-like esterase